MNEVNYLNFVAFLSWLAGPAGSVAWFVAVSSFVRNLREQGGLANWTFWQVQLAVAAVSFLPPFGALALVRYVPLENLEAVQPWWALVAALAVAYLVQQGYYLATKPGKDKG